MPGPTEYQRMARKGMEDFYYFCGAILFDHDPRQKWFGGDFDQEMCRSLQYPERANQLWLLPRGHKKTSLITEGFNLWSAIRNPAIRILVGASDKAKAPQFLSAIRQQLKKNALLRRLYGVSVGKPDTSRHFNISTRPISTKSKEPTFSTASVNQAATSGHYDIFVGDDIVDGENYATELDRASVAKFLKEIPDLLEKQGYRQILVGTRWHTLDAYGEILDTEATAEIKTWQIIQREVETNGVYLFPQCFNDAVMASIRARVRDEAHVLAQYYQKCVDVTASGFSKDYLEKNYIPTGPNGDEIPEGLNWYILVDLAYTDGKRNDPSAFVCLGVDHENGYWISDHLKDKLAPEHQLTTGMDFFHRHPEAQFMGIENKANGFAMVSWVNSELEKMGETRRALTVTIEHVSDLQRAATLIERWRQGKLHIRRGANDLIQELLCFSGEKSDKNDLIAALSLAPLCAIPPAKGEKTPEPKAPQETLVEKDFSRAIEEQEDRNAGYVREERFYEQFV